MEGIIHSYERYSKPVHPVQLYEALFNLGLFFVIGWAYRRRKQDGDVIALYLLTYPVARFAFELLRGDERIRWGAAGDENVGQCLDAPGLRCGDSPLAFGHRRDSGTGGTGLPIGRGSAPPGPGYGADILRHTGTGRNGQVVSLPISRPKTTPRL